MADDGRKRSAANITGGARERDRWQRYLLWPERQRDNKEVYSEWIG